MNHYYWLVIIIPMKNGYFIGKITNQHFQVQTLLVTGLAKFSVETRLATSLKEVLDEASQTFVPRIQSEPWWRAVVEARKGRNQRALRFRALDLGPIWVCLKMLG